MKLNTVKLNRFVSTVAIATAASLALTACGDNNPAADGDTPVAGASAGAVGGSGKSDSGEGNLSGTFAGAGASCQDSAMAAWIAGYNSEAQPGVTVNYDGVGSGAGREQFIAGAVQFAGSDAALDEDERASVTKVCGDGGAMKLPVYISPVAIPFNLKEVSRLNLGPAVLAQIFDQKISNWSDKAIAADNPGVELPDLAITVVNRSDDSGTTENFMEYLSAAAPQDWPYEADKAWPVAGGEAAAQTSGVIQVVGATWARSGIRTPPRSVS